MTWFKKSQEKKDAIAETKRLEQVVSVEIEHHQNATAKTVAETKKVTDNFNRVIKENGFTLKIHVAAGGRKH